MIAKPAEPLPLRGAYARLRGHFGPRHWWPADTAFEVCVGAILVQNTAWTNAERALVRLKRAGRLEPGPLWALPEAELAELLRPAGTFRVKARRLRAFLQLLVGEFDGSLERLLDGPTADVRARLLAVPGIGPETADCFLLYAGGHARLVVASYTRRVFARHGWHRPGDSEEELRRRMAEGLGAADAAERRELWRDFHAQMVAVGQAHCGARRARCPGCPLAPLLESDSLQPPPGR